MKAACYSPTRLIAATVFLLLFIPMSAQWNNIAPLNGGHSIKFVSSTVGYLQNVYTMQKTTNGGVTWTTIDSVGGAFTQQGMYWLNASEGFAVYSENLGFGNYAGWFKKTTNGGASWTTIQQVSSTSALYSVWFTSSATGYVVGENGTIRKTINGGSTWTTLTSTTSLDLYTIQFVNATTGYVGGDDGIILKTVNSGTNWTQQFSSIFYEFLDIEFTDPLNGCATGSYGLIRTTNGGANWNPVTVYGTYQFIALDFPSADTGYMTAPGGNVFRTIDGGASWIGLNHVGNGYFVRDVDFISNDTGFVTCDFDGTWKTTNAGTGCPTLTVQNTSSMPDTIHACSNTYAIFTAAASALNPYVYNVTPSWAWDTAMSYGQYYYVQDSIANDTLQIIITMQDTTTNCGMLTDMVVLITDSTTYQPLSQPTWLLSLCPGDSVVLDLGAGAEDGYFWQNPMDSTQTITVDTIGMYTGTAYACGGFYNYFFFVQWDTSSACGPQICDVDAGPDTMFCQQQGQLSATPASPGNYAFVWSPSTGLDNPFAQNPNVINGVHNQQYVVTMTDIANNCTATDTVIVSAYYFYGGDTFLICNNQPPILDFGPGASSYSWQYFTDTAGNTTNINVSTQTLVATQPGSYMGFAMFPGCGALTSVFTVIDSCLSTCTANLTNIVLNSDQCGDSVRFVGSFSGPIGQWSFDVNGEYYVSGYGGTPTFDGHFGAGSYNVVLYVWDQTMSCYDSASIVYTGMNGFSMNVYTVQVCGAAWNSVAFNPNIVGSTTNLIYEWTPTTGLSNPYIANPYVNNVYNESYTLTVTDTVTGCVVSDTVNGVYVANYVNDTVYSCDSLPVYLSAGAPNSVPGYTYTWQNNANTPGIYVTAPGQYPVMIQTGICTYTSVFTVIDSCNYPVSNVWPGDCNYDLVVNMADALHIGLAYNANGPTRPGASNAWFAQPMVDWTQNYVNCNYKHGDADGNGTINVNDTLPIALNYSLSHPFRLEQPVQSASNPTLQLVCTPDTVGLETLVQIDVVLGSVPMPVDSLYGISFRITSDAWLIDTTLTVINANNSWLGNSGNMFTFQKHFPSAGVIDFAEVKTNHVNTFNGQGVIASFFIVTTDNLSGIQTCHFDLTDVTAVTESQVYLSLNTENDSVVIDPSVPAGVNTVDQPSAFSMYPNPANEQVVVQTSGETDLIEVCDMTGRVVYSVQPVTNVVNINTSNLAEGMYMVRVTSGTTVVTDKLAITR